MCRTGSSFPVIPENLYLYIVQKSSKPAAPALKTVVMVRPRFEHPDLIAKQHEYGVHALEWILIGAVQRSSGYNR